MPQRPSVEGLKAVGNINLYTRPHIKNPDDSMSTVRSMSFGDDRGETLIPTATEQGILPEEDAINHYRQTGQHLGVFDTPEHATNYAEQLHNAYEGGQFDVPLATSRRNADPEQLNRALQGLLQAGPYRIPQK